MKKLLDSYLKENGINRSEVVRKTSINLTTVRRSSVAWPDGREREANEINPRVMFAVAETLRKTPGQVYDELIKLEMENDMTTEETKLLLIKVLDDADATALVTVNDMGDGLEAVVAEIDVPGSDTVRFSVNVDPEVSFSRSEVLADLSDAMGDYTHEDGDEFYPDQPVEALPPLYQRPLIDAEYTGISSAAAEYLAELGKKIYKLAK